MKVGDVIQIGDKNQMLSVLLYSLHKATIHKLDGAMLTFEQMWEKTNGAMVVNEMTNDTVTFVSTDYFDSDSSDGIKVTLPRADVLYKVI